MRVAHVVRQYLPSIGGLEEVVRSLAYQQLRGGKYTPEIFTLNKVFRTGRALLPASETLDGVQVHRLGFVGSERYPLCPQIAMALGNADVIHVHGIDFFFDYLAAMHFWVRKPMVASTHGGFFHTAYASRMKKIYFQTMTRLSANAYSKVIATSENDGEIFSSVVRSAKLNVIENGVDVEKFFGTGAGVLGPVMIYFGRWSMNKGLLECIDLLAVLRAQQPFVPWQLMIAGREYDLNAQTLRSYAGSLGVADCLSLYPNPDVKELRDLIGMASYFLCLSHHEGFGIAPIEAISAGLIPVLSAIAPFIRLHQHTGIGIVLAPSATAAKAQQLSELHARMQLPDSRSPSERLRVQESIRRYSWRGVASQYGTQYDLALGDV